MMLDVRRILWLLYGEETPRCVFIEHYDARFYRSHSAANVISPEPTERI